MSWFDSNFGSNGYYGGAGNENNPFITMGHAGLAQWQCSGFVMRDSPSRHVPSHTQAKRFLRISGAEKACSSLFIPARAKLLGANLGAKHNARQISP